MGRIPDHIVEEVRDRADIVSTVGRYVTLKKAGARYLGLCPFHSEKTPSFSVHPEKQIFYCFGCAVGGDVFAFRMRHEGLEFPDAVRSLAREVGVEIPETGGDTGRVMQIYRANDAAADYFRRALRGREGHAGRDYLDARGVPRELWERFGLGFAPAGWDGLLSKFEGRASLEVAERAGLIAARQSGDGHYDRFRNRVMFPIIEPAGRVIGFGGRVLDQTADPRSPKYLNSPETPVYKKGRALFGLAPAVDAIRAAGRAIVVEGYFDVLALHAAGLREVVAPCGTALTPDHARRLRRYTREVVLLFDADEAGGRAAERSLPALLAEGLRVRAAFLSAGEDPDTLLQERGPEALRAAVNGAVVLLDHLLDEKLVGASAGAWAKSDAVEALTPLLRELVDPIERADYLRTLAKRLDLPVRALEAAIRLERPDEAPPTSRERHISAEELDIVSRTLIGALTARGELRARIEPTLLRALPDGPGREIVEVLVADDSERGLGGLVSPAAERLRPELRDVLLEVAASAEPADAAAAELAVRECVDRLWRRLWDREARALTERLETATDPDEIEALLVEKQRLLEERRTIH